MILISLEDPMASELDIHDIPQFTVVVPWRSALCFKRSDTLPFLHNEMKQWQSQNSSVLFLPLFVFSADHSWGEPCFNMWCRCWRQVKLQHAERLHTSALIASSHSFHVSCSCSWLIIKGSVHPKTKKLALAAHPHANGKSGEVSKHFWSFIESLFRNSQLKKIWERKNPQN